MVSLTTTGIFVGLSTIDIIHHLTEVPKQNQKVTAQSQEILVGGPAANAAVTFAFLGGSTKLVSPVGHHAIAALVRDECLRFGIELIDLTADLDQIPPISSVWVNQVGDRSVVSVNTSRMAIPSFEISPAALPNARVLMVDGHAMKAAQAWAKVARSADVPVVFDGGSWKPETDELLKSVSTAICSADFSPPGCTSEDEVIGYLRGRGVTRIAITHGADPVRFVSPATSGTIDVPKIRAVDTMGAGDIFHGAFCFYDAQGHNFEDALEKAARIASQSCRYRGTRKWMESPMKA